MKITNGTFVLVENEETRIKGEVTNCTETECEVSYIEQRTGEKGSIKASLDKLQVLGVQTQTSIEKMKKPELVEALMNAQNRIAKLEETGDTEKMSMHHYPDNVPRRTVPVIHEILEHMSYKTEKGMKGREAIGRSFGDNGKTYLVKSGTAELFNKLVRKIQNVSTEAYTRGKKNTQTKNEPR